jgi:hypothetical protein
VILAGGLVARLYRNRIGEAAGNQRERRLRGTTFARAKRLLEALVFGEWRV